MIGKVSPPRSWDRSSNFSMFDFYTALLFSKHKVKIRQRSMPIIDRRASRPCQNGRFCIRPPLRWIPFE